MCLTLGNLFDGIGVFPLAASRHGITPVWASEIEKVPISITKRHFPDMLHLGDITKLKGSEIPPVHIITFGSPCQNLSTIGFREGLAGSKSGLFYHAIRIIKEMRCATNGIFPVIAVWENVAGAFSSNHRLDFKSVLESFTDSEIPMPDSGRWAKCGMVRGSVADVCWRLLDAQYWGEPSLVQRRKRVFVVADFAGQRAGEVLFKPRTVLPFSTISGPGGLSATQRGGVPAAQTGRQVPVVRPFSLRRMRTMAQVGDQKGFCASFGTRRRTVPNSACQCNSAVFLWYEGRGIGRIPARADTAGM